MVLYCVVYKVFIKLYTQVIINNLYKSNLYIYICMKNQKYVCYLQYKYNIILYNI